MSDLDFISFVIAAIQKAILSVEAIDNDLFNAMYSDYMIAIGQAKVDIMDALQSMQCALSWAENGADLYSDDINKWRFAMPFDIAVKLLNMAQMIVVQRLRPEPSITEDEHPPVYNSAQEGMLRQSISEINRAVYNITKVQKQKDSEVSEKAVNI